MKGWRFPIAASVALTVVWWTHRILTDLFPPFDNAADTVLWVAASPLKFAAVGGAVWALNRVFRLCHRNLRSAAKAAGVWALAGLLLLVALSLAREPLARHLNNDSARFLPISTTSPTARQNYEGNIADFIARWRSGRVFMSEAAIIVAAVLLLATAALLGGRYGPFYTAAAVLLVTALAGALTLRLGLLISSYDFFFAGTLTGPFVLDVMAPYVATDPTTEIACLAYLTIILSSLVLDRFVLRQATERRSAHA